VDFIGMKNKYKWMLVGFYVCLVVVSSYFILQPFYGPSSKLVLSKSVRSELVVNEQVFVLSLINVDEEYFVLDHVVSSKNVISLEIPLVKNGVFNLEGYKFEVFKFTNMSITIRNLIHIFPLPFIRK